jgi:MFS family permease
MTAAGDAQTLDRAAQRRAIAAGIAGNVMEWYDFSVYGYFATVIGREFFPAHDPTSSLIAAFGVFAAGFLMRPIGSLIFGHIGDRLGRKLALTLSVMVMAAPSFLIGVLPTYAQAGLWAPAFLVLLRLVQGLSVGGEYTTSLVSKSSVASGAAAMPTSARTRSRRASAANSMSQPPRLDPTRICGPWVSASMTATASSAQRPTVPWAKSPPDMPWPK